MHEALCSFRQLTRDTHKSTTFSQLVHGSRECSHSFGDDHIYIYIIDILIGSTSVRHELLSMEVDTLETLLWDKIKTNYKYSKEDMSCVI